ncbi:MAG: hypothetical protein ACPKM0_09545 [Pleomorphochaeta sp.]
MDFYNYKQISIDELRKKSRESLKLGYSPVVIDGRKIAKTWWGEKWCENLENYADFSNRIQRGKRYVRSGAVIDLKIEEGFISALVQGSRRKPYKVLIEIFPLSKKKQKDILNVAQNKIENIESLVEGEFPEELSNLFLNSDTGLFPSPNEIKINCNCPDWAVLCKHATAVLYGIGAKLDENPLMFFLLRSIDFNQFLQRSIEEKKQLMIKNIENENKRLIPKDLAKDLFGFEF